MPLTLNHQKEQLSVAYIRAVAAAAGFSCTKPEVDDDSVDVLIACSGSYGDDVVLRSPRIELQAKATAEPHPLTDHEECLKYPLSVKNYDDLRGATLVPRILVVMIVPQNVEDWIEQDDERLLVRYSAYWVSLYNEPETTNGTTITVGLPKKQLFNVENLRIMMDTVSRGGTNMSLDMDGLVKSVRPHDIRVYLRAKGWNTSYTYQNNIGSVWNLSDDHGEAEILLPEDPSLLDYSSRIKEALRSLEKIEERPVTLIAHDICTSSTDVVRFRVSSTEAQTGSVPLVQASALVRGAESLLMAAACAAISPKSYFPRMSYSEAREYLQGCKMGQTEQGSYIITVFSPVKPALIQSTLFADYDVEESFERKVLYTLFNSLYHLRNAVSKGTGEAIEGTVPLGVSANLCEALTLMQPANDAGELEIGVSWSSTRPMKKSIPQARIKFTKDVFPLIDESVRYLRQTAPIGGFELRGLVRKLESTDTSQGGKAAILALMDDRPVNVSIDLDARSYQVAVKAHSEGDMLCCTGTLEKEGKSYRLTNSTDIRLETNFSDD